MSIPASGPIDRSIRGAAALATLVALQPGLTGIAAIVGAFCACWFATRYAASPIARAWIAFWVALALAGIHFGLSPSLAMTGAVVLVFRAPGNQFGSARWMFPWVAAIALTQLPAVVSILLAISDMGSGWLGIVIVPLVFLATALIGGALTLAPALAAAAATLLLGVGAYQLEWTPQIQAGVVALSAASALLHAPNRPRVVRWPTGVMVSAAITASLWIALPVAGIGKDLVVWIPAGKNAASRFFDEYASVLQAAGFRAVREVTAASAVQPGDWVVLPSAAHADLGTQLQGLRALPYYDTLRILIAGEHTDAEGIAMTLEAVGSPVGLNVDTTIPPGNSNLLGWSAGIGATAPRSLALNRGASTRARRTAIVPLIWIHGGHREPDRSDDGRLGDMQFQRGERAGLYGAFALARESQGATWAVLGDSTPVLNEYAATDPQGLAYLLALATGIPALIGIVAWGALSLSAAGASGRLHQLSVVFTGGLVAASALSPIALTFAIRDDGSSRVIIAQREPYGDRAVGRAVVSLSQTLVDSDVRLAIGTVLPRSDGPTVSVAHPPGWVGRTDCVRAGNVQVETVTMLDIVTCPEARSGAVLLVGDDALAFQRGEQLVVLDQHFLANAAPKGNVDWMKARIRELRR